MKTSGKVTFRLPAADALAEQLEDARASLADRMSSAKNLGLGIELSKLVEHDSFSKRASDFGRQYLDDHLDQWRDVARGIDQTATASAAIAGLNALDSAAFEVIDTARDGLLAQQYNKVSALVAGLNTSDMAAFETMRQKSASDIERYNKLSDVVAGVNALETTFETMRRHAVSDVEQYNKGSAITAGLSALESATIETMRWQEEQQKALHDIRMQPFLDLARSFDAKYLEAATTALIAPKADAFDSAYAATKEMMAAALNHSIYTIGAGAGASALSASILEEFERIARDAQAYELYDAARYAAESLVADFQDWDLRAPTTPQRRKKRTKASATAHVDLPSTEKARQLGKVLVTFLQVLLVGGALNKSERIDAIALILRMVMEVLTGQTPGTEAHKLLFPEVLPQPSSQIVIQITSPTERPENRVVGVVRANGKGARLRENPELKGRVLMTLRGGSLLQIEKDSEVKIGNRFWIRVHLLGREGQETTQHGWIARDLVEIVEIGESACQAER